tara:strand:+ start:494 stop:622 length:129 start_codon:yes stop_codon:yes gene_type:complete
MEGFRHKRGDVWKHEWCVPWDALGGARHETLHYEGTRGAWQG